MLVMEIHEYDFVAITDLDWTIYFTNLLGLKFLEWTYKKDE
jgi:hypothetical protein